MYSDDDSDIVGPSFASLGDNPIATSTAHSARSQRLGDSQDTTLTASVEMRLESGMPSSSDMSHMTDDPSLVDPSEDHPCSAIIADSGALSVRSSSFQSTNTTQSMNNKITYPMLDFESEYSWSHYGKGAIQGIMLLVGGYRDKDTERAFVTRQYISAYSIPLMTVALLIQMTFAVFGLGFHSINLIWPVVVWFVAVVVGVVAIWRQTRKVLEIKREYYARIEAASNQDKPDRNISRRPGVPDWCAPDADMAYRLVLTEAPCNASSVVELEWVTLATSCFILMCNLAIWMALVSRASWAATSPPVQVMVFSAPFSLVSLTSRLRFNRLALMALAGVLISIGISLIERYALGRSSAESNSDFILTKEYLSFHLVSLCGCLAITAAREFVAREHFRRIADVDNAMKRLEMYTKGTRRLLEDRLPPRALGRFLTGETIHDTAKDASVICISFSCPSNSLDTMMYIRTLAALNRDIDNEARNHRIDKATVNGDAYWGTCGLCDVSLSLQHSLKMMNFALSVLEWHPFSIRDDGGETSSGGIEMRIGMHCASMASTIFGAATQGLDVVGSGVSITMELTHYAMVGGTVATDAFMINLGRQTGPSIMDRYSQSFSRVQLQCTKLPIRITHIQPDILDGECVSPLLEIHGGRQTDPVAWFFNSQINPYLRVGCQAQYLMKLMKPRAFRLSAELGLGRKRRQKSVSGLMMSASHHDQEMRELSSSDAPNPLNPWGTKDRSANEPQELDASDYHTATHRRIQLCAVIALMIQSFVMLILILTTGADETLSGIVMVCLGGFLCALLCNILVLITPRLPSEWVSFMSTATGTLAMILILVGVVSLNKSSIRGDVSHMAIFVVTVWPSVSMLHRRLLSAASLVITVVVVAGVLAAAQAKLEPVAFVHYTVFVTVAFAVPLWFDHHFRSEVTLIEEHCLVWGVNVTEQSRCILWSLLKTLIPKHLLVLMLESYGLSGVLDPVALDETLQETHHRQLELRKRAEENFPGPSLLRPPSVFYWRQFAVGAFRLSELMSAQQILAADLFQHISFTHQQLLSVMDTCRHVSLLRAFGDVLLVGGYVGTISANASNASSGSEGGGSISRSTSSSSTANKNRSQSTNNEGAIEMHPTHAETTHALLELLFVACTRMMRYRRTVSMRVGLHVGEVYGTLLGSSQIAFEFVGETISTAVNISQYAPRDRPMASEQFVTAYDRAIDEVREYVVGRDNEDDDNHPLLPSEKSQSRDPVWDANANYKPFMAEWGPSVVLHSQGLQYDISQPTSPLSASTQGADRCLMGMELLTATPLEV